MFNEKGLEEQKKCRTFALALETEVGNAGERPTRDKVQSKACPLQLWSCKSTHCRGSFYAQPTLMKGGSRVWGGNEPQILQPHRQQHAYLSHALKNPTAAKVGLSRSKKKIGMVCISGGDYFQAKPSPPSEGLLTFGDSS